MNTNLTPIKRAIILGCALLGMTQAVQTRVALSRHSGANGGRRQRFLAVRSLMGFLVIARNASIPGLPLLVNAAAWTGRGDIDPNYGEGGRLSIGPSVLVMRHRTLGLLLAVLVCSSCASMQVQPHAQREVLFCQGPSAEIVNCQPVDIRALEHALFGLPGQRR